MYRKLHPVTFYFYPLFAPTTTPDARDTFLARMREAQAEETENLLYVHIPFCNDLCRFCPFHVKIAARQETERAYVEALLREIENVGSLPYIRSKSFKAVYFGGGSPSVLSVELLERLFGGLREHFQIDRDAEITFEGEPHGLSSMELLSFLKANRVTRLSFGLQTYDEETRRLFRIAATLEDVDNLVSRARQLAFGELNADMMYDLPGQDVTSLERDLRHLLAHDFDSVDYYNLHYYAFPKNMKVGFADGSLPAKPSQEMHFSLFEQIDRTLTNAGYTNVVDQVYSKMERPSEYFRLLWGGGYGRHAAETIGLGASARGYMAGQCYMNYANTAEYIRCVMEERRVPVDKVSEPLLRPTNRGEVFFPKFLRVDKSVNTFSEKALRMIQRWCEEDYAYEDDANYYVSARGKKWITNMMLDLFEPNQVEYASESLARLTQPQRIRTGTF